MGRRMSGPAEGRRGARQGRAEGRRGAGQGLGASGVLKKVGGCSLLSGVEEGRERREAVGDPGRICSGPGV